jgi:hypothetical protein
MAVALRGAAVSSTALTAEKKAEVMRLIRDGIRECSEAKDAAGRAHQYAKQEVRDAEAAETDKADEDHWNLEAREATLEKIRTLLCDMRRSDARRRVYDGIDDVYHKTRRILDEDWGDWELEDRAILQRRDNRLCQAQGDRSRVADSSDKTIALLKAIAQALGVEDDDE